MNWNGSVFLELENHFMCTMMPTQQQGVTCTASLNVPLYLTVGVAAETYIEILYAANAL
jgi:hypothetical protein